MEGSDKKKGNQNKSSVLSSKEVKSKVKIYTVMAIFIVILAIIAAFIIIPGPTTKSTTLKLQIGDFIKYNVTGRASSTPISGTVWMNITKVTEDGYDVNTTIIGMVGAGSSTIHYTDNEPLGLQGQYYGLKVDSEQISTIWGNKTVDKYYLKNDLINSTTYIGTNPNVAYRIVNEGPGTSTSMVLTYTNIDEIRNGNAYSDSIR